MRRLAALGLLLVAGLLALVTLGLSGTSGNYRVDGIFDNADYLISGQDVKIAGARVGQVEKVKLTHERKARVQMRIDPGFAPFRSNASCSIRPQSLIGEKFVECEPGDPSGGPLANRGGAPTVPLEHTHSPVDLDLVFTALRLPLRQRLSIVVNELGAGLIGRPHELNAAIRRANPALAEANRTLRILDSERHTLGRLIDASDRVVGELARRRGRVASFIENADSVARTVASRRDDLDRAVHHLPGLLAELQPAAVDLTGLATDARPVVRALGAAAPQVRALLSDFDPLARATRPTLVKLAELSVTGRRAVRASLPVARLLDPVARLLPPTVRIVKPLADSLRDKNVLEAIGAFAWGGAVSTARFDKVSHILPSYQISSSCQQYAEQPVDGCSGRFSGAGQAGAGGSRGRRAERSRRGRAGAPGTGGGAGGGTRGGGRAPTGDPALEALQRILNGVPGRKPGGLPPVDGIPPELLDFLFRP
jgi:phospholipid/cholesterol/gamma-HCH transport system substrate-binding protein